MDLKGIISIFWQTSLAKIISQSRGGLIVEALEDGKRFAVHGAERVSALEDISIYTHDEDLLLTEVFKIMLKASEGKQILSHKSNSDELKKYLKEVLPQYDEERVYTSDIKKLVQWYNILIDKKILKKTPKKKEETSEQVSSNASKSKENSTKTVSKSSKKQS